MLVKTFFILSSLLSIGFNSQSQKNHQGTNFGEGVITIGQSAFAPEQAVPLRPDLLKQQNFSYWFAYFIKGDKILRKDPSDSSLSTNTPTVKTHEGKEVHTSLRATLAHPSYLIDWNTRTTYTFFTKKGKAQISEKPLRDETFEPFYRIIDSSKPVVKWKKGEEQVTIAGQKCYKGVAFFNNSDSLLFYYAVAPLKIHSPLNAFLPSDFKHDILLIKLPVDWTTKDGRKAVGTLIFQVVKIQECKLTDSLFSIPPNVPIRKNVSLHEIFSSE